MGGSLGSLIAAFPTPVTSSFESIATATATGNTITFSNIPQTYKSLQIRFIGRQQNFNLSYGSIRVEMNGAPTVYSHYLGNLAGTTTANGTTLSQFTGTMPGNNFDSNMYGCGIIDIIDYSSTTKNKTVRGFVGMDVNNASYSCVNLGSIGMFSTSAITSLTLSSSGSAMNGTFALYGIK